MHNYDIMIQRIVVGTITCEPHNLMKSRLFNVSKCSTHCGSRRRGKGIWYVMDCGLGVEGKGSLGSEFQK